MGQNDDLHLILQKMKLFKGFNNEELNIMPAYGRQLTIETGKNAIREGQNNPGLYVLIVGEMEVMLPKNTEHTERLSNVLLGLIKRGDYVGEYSLIDHQPASATVIAKEQCLVFHISSEKFDELINEHECIAKKIYRNMLEVLVARVRNYDQELDLIV